MRCDQRDSVLLGRDVDEKLADLEAGEIRRPGQDHAARRDDRVVEFGRLDLRGRKRERQARSPDYSS